MARYRGQKALYEVIGNSRSRKSSSVVPVRPPAVKTVSEKPQEASRKQAQSRWLKPKAIQFNAGKVELTLSYPIALVGCIGLMFVVLVAYRMGQWSADSHAGAALLAGRETGVGMGLSNLNPAPEPVKDTEKPQMQPPERVEEDAGNLEPSVPQPDEPGGNNAICILEYSDKTQLEPVQKHFMEHNIPTEILKRVDTGNFLLVTKERFRDNPATPGTRGHAVLQEVKKVGVTYKAQRGYSGFARKSFESAYGVLLQ